MTYIIVINISKFEIAYIYICCKHLKTLTVVLKVKEGASVSGAFRKLAAINTNTDQDSEDFQEENPQPSSVKGPSTKQPLKRKLAMSQENDASEDADVVVIDKVKEETPAYYVKSAKRGGGTKIKNEQLMTMMESRGDMMKGFTDTFSTLVKNKKENEEAGRKADNVDYWCKILGDCVRRLDDTIWGRFMHHLDGIVLDAEEGIWVP